MRLSRNVYLCGGIFPILTNIKYKRQSNLISDDYNIHFLQLDTNNCVGVYFERITLKGFFARITLPIRLSISGTSSTLIDNILTDDLEIMLTTYRISKSL